MHPRVVPFLSTSRHGRLLSNFAVIALIWSGITFPIGSEQAYVYAKSLWVRPDDRRLRDRIMACTTPLECKRLNSQHLKGHDRRAERSWDQIKEHVMTTILWAKYTGSEVARNALLETGDRLLVEANQRDRYWGVGMTESQVLGEVDRNTRRWVPRPGTNVLGRILMGIRRALQNNERDETILIAGDSMLRNVPCPGRTLCLPGAKFEDVIKAAELCLLPSTRILVIHAGTNDLPFLKPWDDAFRTGAGICPKDGAQKGRPVNRIRAEIGGQLQAFLSNHPGIDVLYSNILYRHNDTAEYKKEFHPGRISRIQASVGRVNDAIRDLATVQPRLHVIQHDQFLDPRLFRKGHDNRVDLHVNKQGARQLALDIRRAVERLQDNNQPNADL
jgi:ribA/ribD-fused uncharacterized protein